MTSDNKNDQLPSRPAVGARWPFGIHSLRGRYLLIAVAFVVFLFASAWYATMQVREATHSGIDNTVERHAARKLLRELVDDIWQIENALQGYLLAPRTTLRGDVERHVRQATSRQMDLKALHWIRNSVHAHERVEHLGNALRALGQKTEAIMSVRADPQKLYPAMPSMVEKMLPAHTNFHSAASMAMAKSRENWHEKHARELYELFAEARHTNVLMVSAFRNWVANRFGVFGEPEAGMHIQDNTIARHAAETKRLLERLQALERTGSLGAQQQRSLKLMLESQKSWLRAYRDVEAIYTSERWRTDTALWRDTIQPLFMRIWDELRELDREIDRFSATDMSILRGIAQTMSHSLWLAALLAALITALALMLFEFSVRRPVARVAAALRAEAGGATGVSLPHTGAVETDDLVHAFDFMRSQIHSRQQRLETVLDNAAEGIVTFDDQGTILGFNRAAEKLFDWPEEKVIGTNIDQIIQPETSNPGPADPPSTIPGELKRWIGREREAIGHRRDGTVFPVSCKISEMTLDDQHLYVGLIGDISERRNMIQRLKKLAEHDGLTGLYNRSFFQAELERVVARLARDDSHVSALMYIDLDNFKYVNDTQGHAAGDQLLVAAGRILQQRARKGDLVARFGGDEFTILLYDISPDDAVATAESFREHLARYRFMSGADPINVSASIGVTTISRGTNSAEESFSQADLACYIAKRSGRNRVHYFRPVDAANVSSMTSDMGWSRRIREAIEQDRFVLAFQPIVNVTTRAVESYEVLIRLREEDGNLIMPSGFLPTAERFGLALEIDKWVIRKTMEIARAQHDRGSRLRYAINLSAQTLNTPDAYHFIIKQLRATGLDPATLIFEVTETAAIADMSAAQSFLAGLNTIGCETALDDFGSGMASFAYLKDLPVTCVKIDGCFVKHLDSSAVDQAMVKAMNDVAHALGKQTIAEFVENEESMRLLATFGVDYAQGYHLGRPENAPPARAARVIELLPQNKPARNADS